MKIWTTPVRYAAAGPLAAIALTAASVSACGGSPSPGDPNGGNSNGGNTINVCRLAPSSRVAAIAGETVIQAVPDQDTSPGPSSFACTYTLSSGNEIRILVEATNSSDVFAANGRGLNADGAAPIASVPGVGDKAVASVNGLAVLTAKDNIFISGVPGEFSGDHAGDIKLAGILIAALG